MARNRVRDQYKNIAVLLRRLVHVNNDYRDLAKMVGMTHAEILKMIQGQKDTK